MTESGDPESCSVLNILSAVLVGLGLVEISTILCSLVGASISFYSALVILILSSGAAGWYCRWVKRQRAKHPFSGSEAARLSWPVKSLVSAAVLVYCLLWLLAYALPDFSYDGLWYHIPAMHFWGLAGRVHWITADLSPAWVPLVDNCLNGFPKGVELVTFVLIQATGLSRLANSVNLPFIPLGVLGVASLSHNFGAKRNFAILSGALFVLIPVNIGQAITSYVDTATAAVYIAAFALLAETLVRIRRGELFWRGLPALGVAAGLAMGAKTPGIVFPPLFAVILGAAFLPAGVRGSFGAKKLILRVGGFIGIFLSIAVLVGGYWPIRNYIRTGNPINPVGVELAGRTIFPDHSWPDQFHSPYPEGTEDWSQFRRVLGSWISDFRAWWPRTTYGSLEGGLGFLWLFGALPAFLVLASGLFLARGRRRRGGTIVRHPAIPLILLGIAILLFNLMPPHHNHLARYTIWLHGLGLPAFALAGGTVWTARRRRWRILGRTWISAVVILGIAEAAAVWIYGLEMTSRYWDDWRSPPPLVSRVLRAFSRQYPSGYIEGTLAHELLSGRSPVALGPLRERRVLMLGRLAEGRAFGEREIHFLDPVVAGDIDRLDRYLGVRNIRSVIWDEEDELPSALKRISPVREFAPGGFQVLAVHPGRTATEPGEP